MTGRRALRDFGPVQLATRLGCGRGDFERARAAGLVPAPDVDGRRWSAALVDELAARADDLHGQIPPPAIGANRAAERLADATGLDVDRADIDELAARGTLPVAGNYKDWPLYDIADLDAFSGGGTVDVVAATDEQARYMADADDQEQGALTAPRPTRVERGVFVTECPPDGFRARCACGWAGLWRGYDPSAAEADAAAHEEGHRDPSRPVTRGGRR